MINFRSYKDHDAPAGAVRCAQISRFCVCAVVLAMLCFLFDLPHLVDACDSRHMPEHERLHWRDRVRGMFQHAYDSYMRNAFPEDELRPLSCTGHKTWGNYSLTLIDSLDTLLVLGHTDEFLRQTAWVVKNIRFDRNISVSIFETNIRIVGGLLAVHQCLMYSPLISRPMMHYIDIETLAHAVLTKVRDLVDRMMPAFDTKTGVPYGYINLISGVSSRESSMTSVAGGGTHLLEFHLLSLLTSNDSYAKVAHRAAEAFYNARDNTTGLIGNHMDIHSGQWTCREASIAGNVDSYYEYLFKSYLVFGIPQYWTWFQDLYSSIQKYLYQKPWYVDVDHMTGQAYYGSHGKSFNSLSAFWPGIQIQLDRKEDHIMADLLLREIHGIWRQYGCLPEGYDITDQMPSFGKEGYPLRPELLESTYLMYRRTKNPVYLEIGRDIVRSIDETMRVPCGFANLRNCEHHIHEDRMESFFLAETLKYAYLLFDEDNWVNQGEWTFNTEAHLIALRPEYSTLLRREVDAAVPHDRLQCMAVDDPTPKSQHITF